MPFLKGALRPDLDFSGGRAVAHRPPRAPSGTK